MSTAAAPAAKAIQADTATKLNASPTEVEAAPTEVEAEGAAAGAAVAVQGRTAETATITIPADAPPVCSEPPPHLAGLYTDIPSPLSPKELVVNPKPYTLNP